MNARSNNVARSTLGRLPLYLQHLKSLTPDANPYVSATTIARALGFGEVQVRKDLSSVSGAGKPKIGYVTTELIEQLESFLCGPECRSAVIIGAGKLGTALLHYGGFRSYGLDIAAAFDSDESKTGISDTGKPVYPMQQLPAFCAENQIRIGIITVPGAAAQAVCDLLLSCSVSAIWNFAPVQLNVPRGVALQQENLALSLAYLNLQIDQTGSCEE